MRTLLTVAYEEYSDSVDGPKLALEMLQSLVEGPLETFKRADPLREAMFHRALMSRIGVSSYSERVAGLQDMLLSAFKSKGHAICANSLMELDFCSHGFMILDTLQNGVEGIDAHDFRFDDSGSSLTYRNLEKVLPLDYGASKVATGEIIIEWPTKEASKQLPEGSPSEELPTHAVDSSMDSEGCDSETCDFFEAAKSAAEAEAGKQGIQMSDRSYVRMTGVKKVSVVHCHELFEVILYMALWLS